MELNPWYVQFVHFLQKYPEENVNTHWKSVKQKGWFTLDKHYCFLCDYSCSSRTSMYNHICNTHPQWVTEKTLLKQKNQIYECSICNTKYTLKKNARRHIQENHHEYPTNCINQLIRNHACTFSKELVNLLPQMIQFPQHTNIVKECIPHPQPYSIKQFLDETCHPRPFKTYVKDGTFELSMEDIRQMEYTGVRDGYIRIFKRFFRKMPIHQRPFHCTDKKRRTFLYMDDSFTWRRDKECIHIETCIDEVKYSLIQCINNWVKTIKDHDPEIRTPHTSNRPEKATTYIRVICLGDTEKEERLNKKRIIQSIVPDVHITKQDIPCRIYNSL